MRKRSAARRPRRLEGLCEAAPGGVRVRAHGAGGGVERLEARLSGRAGFAAHRHDTYAVGITLSGVQEFRYRGAVWRCLPGQCHVLHPDEPHDGAAGADADGFAYRIAYVDPALVRAAIGGRGALPFVARPVLDLTEAQRRVLSAAWDFARPLNGIGGAEAAAAVADLLAAASGRAAASEALPRGLLPLRALEAVRDRLASDPTAWPSAAELERLSGLDRWAIARGFRTAFGTSPSHFRTMRQLDRARRLIADGTPLAAAAAEAGFADQSHFSRQFKRAYGLPPGRWVAALADGGCAAREGAEGQIRPPVRT